jgi:hypothetical protein
VHARRRGSRPRLWSPRWCPHGEFFFSRLTESFYLKVVTRDALSSCRSRRLLCGIWCCASGAMMLEGRLER